MKSKQDRGAMEKTQQQLFGDLENSWKILKKRTTYMNKNLLFRKKLLLFRKKANKKKGFQELIISFQREFICRENKVNL